MKILIHAIAVMSFLVSASTAYTQNAVRTQQVSPMLGVDGGRYVFGQVNEFQQFLLDTQTGRMWRLALIKDGGMVLVPVVVNMGEPTKFSYAPPDEKDVPRLAAEQSSELYALAMDSLLKRGLPEELLGYLKNNKNRLGGMVPTAMLGDLYATRGKEELSKLLEHMISNPEQSYDVEALGLLKKQVDAAPTK